MRIQVKRDGGFGYFPGLDAPTFLDTATLSPKEAQALEAAVREARFTADAPAPPGAADMRSVTITVEGDGEPRSVTVTDPPEDPGLRAIVERVRASSAA
jgi:hypothetical protein